MLIDNRCDHVAAIAEVAFFVSISFATECTTRQCAEVSCSGSRVMKPFLEAQLVTESLATCGLGRMPEIGRECEAKASGNWARLRVKHKVWLEANDEDVAGAAFFQSPMQDVMGSCRDRKPEVEDWEACFTFDDTRIDGKCRGRAAGKKNDGCVRLFVADFGNLYIALLDYVTPKLDFRVCRNREVVARRISGEDCGDNDCNEAHGSEGEIAIALVGRGLKGGNLVSWKDELIGRVIHDLVMRLFRLRTVIGRDSGGRAAAPYRIRN